MHLILNHLWLLLFLTFIIIYFSSFFYPNSLTTMWRIFRCEPGGLHHNSWLPPGVPPSSELPLGHHCPGAFTTHRPQLQPTFWDRETGLQVRTTNRNADPFVLNENPGLDISLYFCWMCLVNFIPLSSCFSGSICLIIITVGPPLVSCL